MRQELTIENLRSAAQRAGLELSDDELNRLLPGVNRARKQAAELREIVAVGDEPAALFDAFGKTSK